MHAESAAGTRHRTPQYGHPSPAPLGVTVLSEAEQRVATLAVQGLTNRAIAAQLFLTISTVEQHLTRIYRKLDVKQRTDLATRLAAVGALGE